MKYFVRFHLYFDKLLHEFVYVSIKEKINASIKIDIKPGYQNEKNRCSNIYNI